MSQDEALPPEILRVKNTLFREGLKRGYTDLSKFPKWAWMFEVSGGALDRCLRDVITGFRDGYEIRYCRQAYVRITDDNNQHVVIARVSVKPRVTLRTEGNRHVEYVISAYYIALIPRFMGILKDAEGYIIFYMEDGKVADAVKALTLSPSTVVHIINEHFPPPFHVVNKGIIKDVLFSAIRKFNLMEMEPTVREELINQLRSVDEDVVFL